MFSTSDLRWEAFEALENIWFVQSVEETERTDRTLSLRLYIRPGLFIQSFLGERSNTLYFSLIDGQQRIFGIDRVGDQWHQHPFAEPTRHEPLIEPMEPKPLLRFLAKVEELLLQEDLL